MNNKLSKTEFLETVLSNESDEYLNAVYDWAEYYALPMDDAGYILSAAEDKHVGEYSSPAQFAEEFYSDVYAERIDAIRSLSMAEPMVAIHFDWEQTAKLIMPNTQGMDYFEANGHYFWAAD